MNLIQDGYIFLVKHNRPERVMWLVVLLNDFEQANGLLDGNAGISLQFGPIYYYEDKEFAAQKVLMKKQERRRHMTKVNFYDKVQDELLKFAVIIAVSDGKLVFCKHRERDTWEAPGGHREAGEEILETARRELYEETGAVEFEIEPVCVYSVTAPDNLNGGKESFGMLYFADIKEFEQELHSEIERTALMSELPDRWTYPEIQPRLLEEAGRRNINFSNILRGCNLT